MVNYKVGIIANPRAGKGLKQFDPIMKLCERPPYSQRVVYFITNKVGDISGAIRKLVNEHHVDVIMFYGGDGTLHRGIDILIYEKLRGNIKEIPLIVTLGGGTMKAIYQWLKWKETPLQIFRKIIDTPLNTLPQRRLQPLAITYFDRISNKKETHYGFMFIIGAVNRVIELYEREGKSPINGLKHTVIAAFATIFQVPRSHRGLVHQFQATLSANDKRLPQSEPLSVVCSVTESLLWGIEPFRGKAETNQFYTVSYSIPAWLLTLLLPIEVRASYIPPLNVFFNQPVTSFTINPESENSFFIDGESCPNKPGEDIQLTRDPRSEITLISNC